MLKLRDEQKKALSDAHQQNFEDQLLKDVALRFYGQFESLGEDKTRKRIAGAVERARGYGMRKQGDIARFVRMTFGLGVDFDTKLPFAAELLNDTSKPISDRLDELKLRARHEGIRQG